MTDNNELPAIFQALSNKAYKTEATSMAPTAEEQAAAVISELSVKYPAWAMADVLKLKRSFNDAHSVSNEARTAVIKEDLYRVSHDIKGQGGTFGYPLMTEMAASLCDFIKSRDTFEHEDMLVIKTHIDDLELILNEKLAGNGGDSGNQLREKIKKVSAQS